MFIITEQVSLLQKVLKSDVVGKKVGNEITTFVNGKWILVVILLRTRRPI